MLPLEGILLLEKYANENNIPIMEKDGINFLVNYIKENNIKTILEIGSAIGYSAIMMALVNKNIMITTLEKDLNRYNEAVKNIRLFNLEKQIKIINIDALEYISYDKYDLIFIDAAKSKSIEFFNKYSSNLNSNGAIITDNLGFHGLVENPVNLSKNLNGLIKKINNYIDFLKNNNEYETEFVNIGDKISISKKKS